MNYGYFCTELGPHICRIHENTHTHSDIISHPEGELQVLSSPHLHPSVVRPQVMEVPLAHSKQTTCHSRRPEEGVKL